MYIYIYILIVTPTLVIDHFYYRTLYCKPYSQINIYNI